MSYTTTTAIRESIESTIKGLTTSGAPLASGDGYRRANSRHEWAERPDVDIDRRYTVDIIERGEPQMFGAVGEIDYDGEFVVVVGHAKTGDVQDGLDRMNTDLAQICQELERTTNRPTGVGLIRYIGMTTDDQEEHWITELRFRILFTLQIS